MIYLFIYPALKKVAVWEEKIVHLKKKKSLFYNKNTGKWKQNNYLLIHCLKCKHFFQELMVSSN
jgi:hypothetical protein